MRAITAWRKQQLVFLVPDAIAEKFDKALLSYDDMLEELDGLGGLNNMDYCVVGHTVEADLDETISLEQLFREHTDKNAHKVLITTITMLDRNRAA